MLSLQELNKINLDEMNYKQKEELLGEIINALKDNEKSLDEQFVLYKKGLEILNSLKETLSKISEELEVIKVD